MVTTATTGTVTRNVENYIARLVAGGMTYTDAARLLGATNATTRLAGEPLRFSAATLLKEAA